MKIQVRRNTQDEMVYKEVVLENQYRLPDRFEPDSSIVDIGAHIGLFALACLLRGAGQVVCVEPEPANVQYLRRNLREFPGRVTIIEGAVWDDSLGEQVGLQVYNDGRTAMHNLSRKGAIQVPRVDLDWLLWSLDQGQGIRLLKLDCEGAEYPTLYSCRELGRVQEIVGESHTLPGPERLCQAQDGQEYEAGHCGLLCFLQHQGFLCRSQPVGMPVNKLFFGLRPSLPRPPVAKEVTHRHPGLTPGDQPEAAASCTSDAQAG